MTIHQDLSQLTQAQLIEMVQSLAKAGQAKLTMKVSEKGALSICGLQRFPVTLYASQWLRLLDTSDAIRDFIKTNASLLASKTPA